MTMYNQKIEEAEIEILSAQKRLKSYQEKAEASKKAEGIEKWIGYPFESSSGLTPEYAQFAKEIRSYIKKITAPEFVLINFNRGHFYFSGFLTTMDGTKTVYFSSSDVRFFPGSWHDNLLIRTAKHPKDYTGGRNDACKITDLKQAALNLIK